MSWQAFMAGFLVAPVLFAPVHLLIKAVRSKAPFCSWCGAVRVKGGGRCPACVKFTGDAAAPGDWPQA